MMIILKIIGGLGNQMFQIAFARSLSLKYNEKLYIDTSVYKNYKIRNYSITNLIISDYVELFDKKVISFYERKKLEFTQKSYHILQRLFRELRKSDVIGKKVFNFLMKKGLYYNFDSYYYPPLTTDKKIKCVYGYFQSEKYFSDYCTQIKRELKVKTEPSKNEQVLINEISNCNSVGISIRTGDDYLNSKELNVCSENYFIKGMDLISSMQKDVIFYIFSDDINRVKNRFKFKYNVNFIEGFKDYESLRLLYNCKHFIISNSSFSWWGAYLSENPTKIIIAPNRWYNNSSKRPDIYFDKMLLLDV